MIDSYVPDTNFPKKIEVRHAYNNLHFSIQNLKLMSLECLYKLYVAGWLRESKCMFPVCVMDQLSDHFGILWYHHIMNFWTMSTNLQSLYLYTTGKFSTISCTDLQLAVIDVIKI